MSNERINCPNCDEEYSSNDARCPRCNASNPLRPEVIYHENEELKKRIGRLEDELKGVQDSSAKGSTDRRKSSYNNSKENREGNYYPPGGGYIGSRDDYYSYGRRKQTTRTIVVAVSAIAGVMVLLVAAGVGSFNTIFVRDPPVTEQVFSDNTDDTESDNLPTEEAPMIDVISDVIEEEPVEEQRQVEQVITLLETQVTFLGRDAKTFTFEVPNEDVGFLRGSIIPEANSAVDVIFSYNNRQQVAYTVFGVSSTQIQSHNREVNIPVNPDDVISLTIKTSDSQQRQSFSQDISIHLYVSYAVQANDPESEQVKAAVTTPVADNTPTAKRRVIENIDEYREYALSLINEDRKDHGLSSVRLSDNTSAQKHAIDILQTRYLSHWTTDGMKPYMRYTINDGLGAVAQNAAFSGYSSADIPKCDLGIYNCPFIDVGEAIREAEYGMMYDDAHANWGHRDNILDPNHTHVSIGIAYDGYTFAFVQNFEDLLFSPIQITQSGYEVTINGSFAESQKYEAKTVNVYYDALPTADTYEREKAKTAYDQGTFVGFVNPPLSPGWYYTGDDFIVDATRWQANSYWVDISANLFQFYKKHGSGVYTVYLIVGTPSDDKSLIQATSYSVFLY